MDRNDFEAMSIKSDLINENKMFITEIASLHIFKVVFEENNVWEFYYKGNKIKAQISDKEFFDKINCGESFAKGDILKVELQINQIFDSNINTFINKSFQINRVINHEPKNKQQKLNLNDLSK